MATIADDLCTNPRWRPEDLGKPLPDSPHAVSVAMPLWQHVEGYEEGRQDIVQALQMGYPRFFIHPKVQAVFAQCRERFAREGECAFAFPSEGSARRAVDYVKAKHGVEGRTADCQLGGIWAAVFPESEKETVRAFWQHGGEVVSSRQAEAALSGRNVPVENTPAHQTIRERVAQWLDESAENVYLFPTGMAGAYAVQRALVKRTPNAKTIQCGFCYVDLLKTQQEWGSGVHFLPHCDGAALDEVERILDSEKIAAVYCEFPSNPLLECIDLPQLRELTEAKNVPLIVDDTLATSVNVNVMPYADAVITSLTKLFSGTGDVIAGSVTLNSASPRFDELKTALFNQADTGLWPEDAVVLEENSRDYAERVRRINATAGALVEFLTNHPKIARVYYPTGAADHYRRLKRDGAAYGPLFSVVLNGGVDAARHFYDNLRVSKGPSLGANFTLACPYMLLAHYKELDWAESHGLPRHLVRVSVGLEEPADLIERFGDALDLV